VLKVKIKEGISLLQTSQDNVVIQGALEPSSSSEGESKKEKVLQEMLLLEDKKNKLQEQLSLLEIQTTKVQTSLKAARRELTATLVEKSRAQKEMTHNALKSKEESQDNKCPATVCEVCKEQEPLPFLSYEVLTFICVALILCFLGAISHLQTSHEKIKKTEKKFLVLKTAHDETKKLLVQLEESQQSKANQRSTVSPVPDSPTQGIKKNIITLFNRCFFFINHHPITHTTCNPSDYQEKLDSLSDTIKSLKRQLKVPIDTIKATLSIFRSIFFFT